MAGLGRKIFTAGDVLTASDVQNYMMDQSVMYFAGTAARSSAIATPTTGMTSYIGVTGTASIPQIETYTGSAWQTPYGMTQLANVSVSAVASVDVTSCFSATFTNYHIEANVTAASNSNTGIGFQMLVGSTPTAGSPWQFGSFYCDGAGGNGRFVDSIASASAWIMQAGFHTSNRVATASVDLKNPFTSSARTSYNVQNFNSYGTGNTHAFGGGFTDDTSYNGIRFIPQSGGTFTGNIRIYGYRNS